MGIYINRDSTGTALPAVGKVEALLKDGAKIAGQNFQPNLICVVESGNGWDAAMYCETTFDFDRTTNKHDTRKKTYLVHPKAAEIADK